MESKEAPRGIDPSFLNQPGNYTRPWIKRHAWLLAGVTIPIVLIAGAALIAPSAGPTRVTVEVSARGEPTIRTDAGVLEFGPFERGSPITHTFRIFNESSETAYIRLLFVQVLPPGVESVIDVDGVRQATGGVIAPGGSSEVKLTLTAQTDDKHGFREITFLINSSRRQ